MIWAEVNGFFAGAVRCARDGIGRWECTYFGDFPRVGPPFSRRLNQGLTRA